MSMHRIPLTDIEFNGLKAHGLEIGTPSQLSDVFRQGIRYALDIPTIRNQDIRLIVQYSEGDGYTYSCKRIIPIVYKSKEDFIFDFEEKCIEAKENGEILVIIANIRFNCMAFFNDNGEWFPPEVYTVDEWFSINTKSLDNKMVDEMIG